ncbi:hypothetical protein GEV33_003519 [Tenebrio molitor]|uniref:Protein giant-lens n=1 Tax=Tenebrio molitor TaxID=7067 RepID=A0A8J6HS58_TENMO|nr:hypothetical protein GEV33_003519 [Tenebrio molitor]
MKAAFVLLAIALPAAYCFYLQPNYHVPARLGTRNAPVYKSLGDLFHRLHLASKRCVNTVDESCINGGGNDAGNDEDFLNGGDTPGKRCANLYDESCSNGGINGAGADDDWSLGFVEISERVLCECDPSDGEKIPLVGACLVPDLSPFMPSNERASMFFSIHCLCSRLPLEVFQHHPTEHYVHHHRLNHNIAGLHRKKNINLTNIKVLYQIGKLKGLPRRRGAYVGITPIRGPTKGSTDDSKRAEVPEPRTGKTLILSEVLNHCGHCERFNGEEVNSTYQYRRIFGHANGPESNKLNRVSVLSPYLDANRSRILIVIIYRRIRSHAKRRRKASGGTDTQGWRVPAQCWSLAWPTTSWQLVDFPTTVKTRRKVYFCGATPKNTCTVFGAPPLPDRYHPQFTSDSDLPECGPRAICNKIDMYDIPWIEKQCRCSEGRTCPLELQTDDGFTMADKTRQYKLCESVKKIPKCRFFRDTTWTITLYTNNVTEQIVHCHCPKNSMTYLTKRQALHLPSGQIAFQYHFSCSPQARLRCQRKEPCRLFTVRKRQEFLDEVNVNSLCQCPHAHRCPRHHMDYGVIAGKSYTEEAIKTYSVAKFTFVVFAKDKSSLTGKLGPSRRFWQNSVENGTGGSELDALNTVSLCMKLLPRHRPSQASASTTGLVPPKDAAANNLNKFRQTSTMRVVILVVILCAVHVDSQFWTYPQQLISTWLRQGKTGSDKVTALPPTPPANLTTKTSPTTKGLQKTTLPAKSETKRPLKIKTTQVTTVKTTMVPISTTKRLNATTRRIVTTSSAATEATPFDETTTHEPTATTEEPRENQRTHEFYLSKREKPQIKIASNISQTYSRDHNKFPKRQQEFYQYGSVGAERTSPTLLNRVQLASRFVSPKQYMFVWRPQCPPMQP